MLRQQDRETTIRFFGGPKEGEGIRWTQPCSPREKLEYFRNGKRHVYIMAIKYQDDIKVAYHYVHTKTTEVKEVNRPYYA